MTRLTKTTTFRIDENHNKELKIIANENQISTNTLVNQIIGNYVTIEKPLKQFGIIVSSTDLFLELIKYIKDEELKKIGKKIGSTEPKEFIQFKWNIITRGTVLEFLSLYCNHCGYGNLEIKTNNETIKMTINHGLGEKFSIYLQAFLESVFESTLKKTCTFNVRKNMMMFEIPEN